MRENKCKLLFAERGKLDHNIILISTRFYMLLWGNNALKEKTTVHSSMAYYVHVPASVIAYYVRVL
jgi:hypothetical protein